MSKLDELLNSFENDPGDASVGIPDGWLYYGNVDPQDAKAELATLRAERVALFNIAVLAFAVDEGISPDKMTPAMSNLTHALANDLDDELWERINNAAL